jgi:hypothetical protein
MALNALKSILGRRLGVGGYNQLVSRDINISQPCADASITVAAEVGDARAITIQLKDALGNDIDYVETVMVALFTTAARTAFVTTGGSTGIAIGTDGALLALVAKKVFLVTSESDGDIDLTWTDTGTEAAFLALYLPNGRVVMSAALTNA